MNPESKGAIRLLNSQIEDTLAASTSRQGGRVVSGVRIDLGGFTQDYPHILIDRFGLLALDVQIRPGARVKGSAAAKAWIVRAAGTPVERIINPLHSGRRRVEILGDTLLACGRHIAPEYISFLVVFAGADLTHVSLPETEGPRLIDLVDLEASLAARYDYAINAGIIEQHEIDDLASLMRTLDRSEDPVLTSSTGRRRGIGFLGQRRKPGQAEIADACAGIAPVAPRLLVDRYPQVEAKKVRRNSAPLLLLLGLAALAVWLFLYDGRLIVDRTLDPFVSQMTGGLDTVAPNDGGTAAGVSVDTAEQVLFEAAPEVHGALAHPGRPDVTLHDGFITFTWVLVDERPPDAPEAKISLTFDGAGEFRGVRRE